MNTQFQKLAEQAGMYVDLNGKPWPKWMGAEECDQAYAKFAELIVQECATVIERNLFKGIGWNTSRAVKRHFGLDQVDE
jgi:hypothetical protein